MKKKSICLSCAKAQTITNICAFCNSTNIITYHGCNITKNQETFTRQYWLAKVCSYHDLFSKQPILKYHLGEVSKIYLQSMFHKNRKHYRIFRLILPLVCCFLVGASFLLFGQLTQQGIIFKDVFHNNSLILAYFLGFLFLGFSFVFLIRLAKKEQGIFYLYRNHIRTMRIGYQKWKETWFYYEENNS